MKRIVGLDLGTNSIGWAVVDRDDECCENNSIAGAGSRIIPMDAATLGDFAKGNTKSTAAQRTSFRGIRRLTERRKLRRERLLRVLGRMGFLPPHFAGAINRFGTLKDLSQEPKLAWTTGADGKPKFLFESAFNEMLCEFREAQPQWLASGGKMPHDWTLYYLRKKGLTSALTPYELAWVLLSFNAKRGYHQLRDDEEETVADKNKEYVVQKVVSVEDSGEKSKSGNWYNVVLDNGMVYRRTFPTAPDWVGQTKEFIVTTSVDSKGNPKLDKDGNVKRKFSMPSEDDWTLRKKRSEAEIDRSDMLLGEYIYSLLLHNPEQKVIGNVVRVIDRTYYRQELIALLNKQKEFIPELTDDELYDECIRELYSANEAYRMSIANRDFTYLLADDILMYQRPLKSKKSLIANCPFESRHYVGTDSVSGERKVMEAPVKCIAKSNPLYQEFRLWQFVSNLRIYQKEKLEDGKLLFDVDVTYNFIYDEESKVKLFEELNNLVEITQQTIFGYFKIKKVNGQYPYRWNYVEDKTYPGNETRGAVIKALKKVRVDYAFLSEASVMQELWHTLYSIDDKVELRKALGTFACKHGLGETFVEAISQMKPYKKDYGAYSEKAIKKLLPLMRCGRYWSADKIDASTTARINKLIDGEWDESISDKVREFASALNTINDFKGLPLWLASYVVYGRHSEGRDCAKWASPADIDNYLLHFKQHSLRNPIVEQVIMETLRTVRDIWVKYGKIDEFHIELGREMKNPADKRKRITEQILKNENARMRAKLIMAEYMNSADSTIRVENLRPYSPSQQDLFRIYEDGVLDSENKLPDYVDAILKSLSQSDANNLPTSAQVNRYLLWLDQRYVSPYTGQPIPLSKLFTADYEIEHIIPQSRYFDDSFSNKVICEARVNKEKDNMLGFQFIKEKGGLIVELGGGRKAEILKPDAYRDKVNEMYKNNQAKRKKLLLEDIPDDFIQRQLNDSRYISKVVKSLLSNVVRENGEETDISKNVITCTGGITDRLKNDWGVNNVWNRLIIPRFERLNELTGRTDFTAVSATGHEIPSIPLELQRGFSKKRIDHRHHAMDAIVIACATREHVNLLNNEAAMTSNNYNRRALSRKLRNYEDVMVNGVKRSVPKDFIKPWPTFNADVETALRGIVVSFKQNLRLVTKAQNRYQHFSADGTKKAMLNQTKGELLAMRKSLHKETVFGKVNLRCVVGVQLKKALEKPCAIVDKELRSKIKDLQELGYDNKAIKRYFEENKDVWSDVNLSKIKVYEFSDDAGKRLFASRTQIDASFEKKKIEKITDTGIQKIMLRHLEANGGNAKLAFSPDGIEKMNRNIVALNDEHQHKPILKARVYEESANKFAVGERGNKKTKFVEAAKGTNLFFAVYENEIIGETNKTREFVSIALDDAIRRKKKGLPVAPEGTQPSFVLSPNDLVYVPTQEELASGVIAMPLDCSRIYKMVSCGEKRAFWVPQSVAKTIYTMKKDAAKAFCRDDKFIVDEFGLGSPMSKSERPIGEEKMIKDVCIPLKVNRLGEYTLQQNLSE